MQGNFSEHSAIQCFSFFEVVIREEDIRGSTSRKNLFCTNAPFSTSKYIIILWFTKYELF